MQIKTIKCRLDYSEDFDKEVNTALNHGWTLAKRELVVPNTSDKHIMVYAEMIKGHATQRSV